MNQETQGRITWDKATEEKFQKILEQIPDMVRGIAEVRITKKAESILREQNRQVIGEKDMIDAFFAETPPIFVDAMKNGMDELGIDYKKYGYG
jgi:hypothetical protein